MKLNPNIRPAFRHGNVVTINEHQGALSATMIFCNERGATDYMNQRYKARYDHTVQIKTKTFVKETK